jgi:hypothetical protein
MNPERMAAMHVGKRVQARLASGVKSFTKAVKITPITSPIIPERITRYRDELFNSIASYASSREKANKTRIHYIEYGLLVKLEILEIRAHLVLRLPDLATRSKQCTEESERIDILIQRVADNRVWGLAGGTCGPGRIPSPKDAEVEKMAVGYLAPTTRGLFV